MKRGCEPLRIRFTAAAAKRLGRRVRSCVAAVVLLVVLGASGLPARHRPPPAGGPAAGRPDGEKSE